MSTATTSLPAALTDQSYDEVPYPGGAFRPTHPCHLGMVMRLCGLTPTPPSKCRVLELGCSMGANLIPMAQDLPGSEFVGIDLSQRQVAEGAAMIDSLALKNIELRHLSITDVGEDLGRFDYIICHGVYSWVPQEVRQKILEIGKSHLSPNGTMYVSYNTYPGWHLRAVVREMMRYHVADFDSPQMKIRQARGLLDFLVKYAKSRTQTYAELLKDEAKMLEGSLDSYIYHEHLEEVNEPVYFHEFVRRVDGAGLRYLADAHISSMVAQMFDESAAEILRDVPLLRREQYMDFLRNRMFRSSLVCHTSLHPTYKMPSSLLLPLHVALSQPATGERKENGEVYWKQPNGRLTTEWPVTEVVETLNARFPSWVAVKDLVSGADDAKRAVILDALLMGFVHGTFVLAEEPVGFCDRVTERPMCSPYTRLQAKKGNRITGRLHNDWILQPQQRYLVEHLDGSRTAEELATMLQAEVVHGRFRVTKDGQPIAPNDAESLQIVKSELERMRTLACLIA
ncbi:MAG: methyltransferase regulatory domain-containing protein [Pirellulaceae bacterium]